MKTEVKGFDASNMLNDMVAQYGSQLVGRSFSNRAMQLYRKHLKEVVRLYFQDHFHFQSKAMENFEPKEVNDALLDIVGNGEWTEHFMSMIDMYLTGFEDCLSSMLAKQETAKRQQKYYEAIITENRTNSSGLKSVKNVKKHLTTEKTQVE